MTLRPFLSVLFADPFWIPLNSQYNEKQKCEHIQSVDDYNFNSLAKK
jgi:hypothetical protein